jgi:hypothetical protein
MERKWRSKSTFPAARKAALCQPPSIESRWVKEVIEPMNCQLNGIEIRFSGSDDSNGNLSDLDRIL